MTKQALVSNNNKVVTLKIQSTREQVSIQVVGIAFQNIGCSNIDLWDSKVYRYDYYKNMLSNHDDKFTNIKMASMYFSRKPSSKTRDE